MRKELFRTADGSMTFYIPELNEHYHSHHGAIQEAKHVFLEAGLNQFDHKQNLNILEIGFGTGLNAWLSALERQSCEGKITYLGVEAFPLSAEEIASLNYTDLIENPMGKELFERIHAADWDKLTVITENFSLQKIKSLLSDLQLEPASIDLIYFDAFGPRVQPEMWTLEVFNKLANYLKKDGIFVTYCAKGQVKRDLREAGFKVETLPGPPGKREMVRGEVELRIEN